jgi:hypothetical protein
MAEENHPEKRPGPFAQDPSRTPPTKEQRDNDYLLEKKETGEAIKKGRAQERPPSDELPEATQLPKNKWP